MNITPLNATETKIHALIDPYIDHDGCISARLDRHHVKLLTYNFFLRPLVKTNHSDYKYERLEEFSKCLEDFDIICHQEVFCGFNSFKATCVTMAHKAGFTYSVLPSRPWFFSKHVIDSGLLILSRFPIVAKDEIKFKKGLTDCYASSKGALYAKIKIGSCYLHLFNTHLQANYYDSSYVYRKGLEVKFYQLRQLTEFMEEKTKGMPGNDLILLAGDFNISSRKASPVTLDLFRQKAAEDNGFKIFLDPKFDSLYEYKIMMKLLSNERKFDVIDYKEQLADEEGAPSTYGNVVIDDDGEEMAIEFALTGKDDLKSKQSLDYILQLVPQIVDQESFNVEDEKEKEMGILNKAIPRSDMDKRTAYLAVDNKSVRIEEFQIEGREFNCLSDHHGVSIQITLHNDDQKQ